MPIVETERLILRPWSVDDADFVLDLYSRWEVQRFLGRAPAVMRDRAEALARIEAWSHLDSEPHGIWAVQEKESGNLTGTLLLKSIPASGPVPEPSGDTEIGWHFHPDYWGRGYATEAAAAVLTYGLDRGLPLVVAVTNPENTASKRVCERIGLRYQGQTDRYYNAVCELFTTEESSAP